MWLLLVEDEISLATSLKRGLEEEGYTVDVAYDGEAGCALGLVHDYDLMIVDWRLPKKDGHRVIEQLREAGRRVPILMLTALGGIDHRVAGLDAGADDYLTKPFSFEELLARLRALARRARQDGPPTPWLKQGLLEIDTARRRVSVQGAVLDVRPKEYALLEVFMRAPGQVLSRTVLAERVWGSAFHVSDNVIDVSISRLRQKLADALKPHAAEHAVHIQTIRGVGYCLVVETGS